MAAGQQAEAREAASVILLRDGPNGLQAWVMRRVVQMLFAAGMNVFPGGKVDDDDVVTGRTIPQPDLAARARQLSTTPERAGALVSAAARETFEEVAVLLSDPIAVAPHEAWAAVERRERLFSDVLRELGVRPNAASILPWARWITPPSEPRRFDTYFFVAAAPEGSKASAVTGEASHAGWVDVHDAVAENRAGSRPMLPPTFSNLTDVGSFSSVADVIAEAATRTLQPVRPQFEWLADGGVKIDVGGDRTVEMSAASVASFPRPPQ